MQQNIAVLTPCAVLAHCSIAVLKPQCRIGSIAALQQNSIAVLATLLQYWQQYCSIAVLAH